MTLRSHPEPEARGGSWEEPPMPARGEGRRPGGATRGVVAVQAQEGLEELPTLRIRNGGGKEIPLVQGKEQRLCFAGAAVKR